MNVKDDKFIFTKKHRQLTYLGALALAPLFLTALAISVSFFTNITLVTTYLDLLILIGYGPQIILWLVLPLVSILLSWRGLQHGTRRYLRKWNSFLVWTAGLLFGGIFILAVINLF